MSIPSKVDLGEFLAVGGSVTVNGVGTQDLRLDEKHTGVRFVRGTNPYYLRFSGGGRIVGGVSGFSFGACFVLVDCPFDWDWISAMSESRSETASVTMFSSK